MTEKPTTSTVKSGEKILRVLKAMRGHSLSGVKLNDLAKQLQETPSQIYRALQTLVAEGFAHQLDDGSYALGNSLVSIAHAHANEIDRAQSRISEHVQRVTAGVNQIKSGN